MPCMGEPYLIPYPYTTIVHKPDPVVESYEVYKNIGRKYTIVSRYDLADVIIRRAITELPIRGGRIFIKSGYYLASGKILVDRPALLEGETFGTWGPPTSGTFVKLANGVNDHLFHFDAINPLIGGGLKYLTLDGNKANQVNANIDAVYLANIAGSSDISDLVFEGLLIYNAKRHGISVYSDCWNIWYINDMLEYCGVRGLYIGLGNNHNILNSFFVGNEVGVELTTSPYDVKIQGGSARLNTVYGISIGGTSHVYLGDGLTVFDNGSSNPNNFDGIIIWQRAGVSSRHIIITGVISRNRATANQRYGINWSDAGILDSICVANDCVGNALGAINIAVGADVESAHNQIA